MSGIDLYRRVSIRKYEDRPVEEETTMEMLRAAMAAPSAGNQQPWEFYVVTNREKLSELADCSPYAKMVRSAPAAIVSAYRSDGRFPPYAVTDLSIAMEHIWLSCDEQGLGGVWCGIAPLEDRMKRVEKVLEMPPEHRAFGIFAYGYSAETKKQEDRFRPERIHFVR